MSHLAVKIENLSKQYRLGQIGTGTLSHDLNRWFAKVRGKEDPTLKIGQENTLSKKGGDYVWALKDINLEIQKGEVLGIIGKNGAGKSTLLKILSRVTGPTTGSIKVNGRIASLLEVGTGFHPELSGRENIYLNGAILGMTKREITSKLDEIVEFAGVAKYLDTPVKRYSSGMYVRLAFAVAAHLESEILVVDEVLAVGDAEFQKKAIGKMQDVSRGEGRTVLFVSHNMASVRSLCNKGILLKNGTLSNFGSAEEIINIYTYGYQKDFEIKKEWIDNYPTGENIKLLKAELISENNFSISSDIFVNFTFEIKIDMLQFNASLVLYTLENEPIFNSWSEIYSIKKGKHKAQMKIPSDLLNNSVYKIRILFVNYSIALIDLYDILHFEATENEIRDVSWYGDVIGIIRPKLIWEIE